MNKAIFIDRDGVLNNSDNHEHVYKEEDLIFYPDVVDALTELSATDYKLFIVTNQAGIGQGLYSEDEFLKFQELFVNKLEELSQHKIAIEKTYYCPHDPADGQGEYKIECECRKPNSGMLKQASKEFNIDLKNSYMIGDRYTDVLAGAGAGCTTILLRTGADYKESESDTIKPNYIFDKFSDILEVIKK
jgi:D-glycero-D-manno-heptose 1,7-bisphosphate phosphatase